MAQASSTLRAVDPRAAEEVEFRFSDPPNLPEELRMLREQVRRFVEREVVPHADEWERDGKIPRAVFRHMGELGFLGMRQPVEHGGTDMGPLASMVFAGCPRWLSLSPKSDGTVMRDLL